jgi:two-component sensor histidine kinase
LRYDIEKRKIIEEYQFEEDGIRVNVVQLFKSEYNAKIYAVSEYGIYEFNKVTNKFVKLNHSKLKDYRFSNAIDDKRGMLWISAYSGVIGYNLKTNSLTQEFITENDMGYVTKVATDGHDNVWFNCQKGIWCWIQDKRKMVKFGYELGIPDNRVLAGINASIFKDKIYAGVENGVVVFQVDSILDYNTKTKALITDIVINNEKYYNHHYAHDNKIVLRPSQRNITLKFSVPDFNVGHNYDYFYRLNRSAWIKLEQEQLSFNKLGKGRYDFEIKGRLKLNGVDSDSDRISFYIQPYWYETNIFKFLLVLGTAALLYIVYYNRVKQIQRNAALKSEFDKKMITMELANLRTQMNPHFIFNSLNSINGFIVDNETRLASDYLTKFSRLVRMILENSKSETVSLQKEIDTLKLYLLMEQLRFDSKFTYEISLSNNVDSSAIKVPPMILQPFVENSIWHGLLPKKGGKVKIDINIMDDQLLHIIIIDNGIGRLKAAELKSKSGTTDKSYGMEITKQRIESLNNKNSIKINDVMEGNSISGTRVEILLAI